MYFNSVSSLQNKYDARDRLGRLQDLMLCLMMQLIAIVPESQLAEIELLHRNLDALGQRTILIDESLELLLALRAAIPSQLMIVIDYCQVLEASGDLEYSRTLYRFFQTICRLRNAPFQATTAPKHRSLKVDVNDSGEQKIMADSSASDSNVSLYTTKVCLTTDGYMNTLGLLRKKGVLGWVQYDNEADELGCDDTDTFE